jgi:hypothetical protein
MVGGASCTLDSGLHIDKNPLHNEKSLDSQATKGRRKCQAEMKISFIIGKLVRASFGSVV